jgi:hypothetical protein
LHHQWEYSLLLGRRSLCIFAWYSVSHVNWVQLQHSSHWKCNPCHTGVAAAAAALTAAAIAVTALALTAAAIALTAAAIALTAAALALTAAAIAATAATALAAAIAATRPSYRDPDAQHHHAQLPDHHHCHRDLKQW